MTVSTVIASLLPIMWSSRAGAEVMKPLATPVLGGMVSSLLHVLIVTPVIFFWLRERRLKKEEPPHSPAPSHVIESGEIEADKEEMAGMLQLQKKPEAQSH